jgi:hypothetical protein
MDEPQTPKHVDQSLLILSTSFDKIKRGSLIFARWKFFGVPCESIHLAVLTETTLYTSCGSIINSESLIGENAPILTVDTLDKSHVCETCLSRIAAFRKRWGVKYTVSKKTSKDKSNERGAGDYTVNSSYYGREDALIEFALTPEPLKRRGRR